MSQDTHVASSSTNLGDCWSGRSREIEFSHVHEIALGEEDMFRIRRRGPIRVRANSIKTSTASDDKLFKCRGRRRIRRNIETPDIACQSLGEVDVPVRSGCYAISPAARRGYSKLRDGIRTWR